MSTKTRRKTILELIAHRAIHTQDELVSALEEKGFTVSQASVSRDISALGLVKAQGAYVRPASPPVAQEDPVARKARRCLVSADAAGPNLLVLRTLVGEASSLALAIDASDWPDVLGSVAGDDTIFVATRDGRTSERVLSLLQGYLPQAPKNND